MIIEMRYYDLMTGALRPYLANYIEHGHPVSIRHGLQCAAYGVVDVGTLHQVVHFWLHDSLAARQQRRMPRDADPDWIAYQSDRRDRVKQQRVQLFEAIGTTIPFDIRPPGGDLTVIEVCRYRIAPSACNQFNELFESVGKPAREQHAGSLLAAMQGVSGTVNEIVHLWYWASYQEREQVLAASATAWATFWDQAIRCVQHQQVSFIRPVAPSPLR